MFISFCQSTNIMGNELSQTIHHWNIKKKKKIIGIYIKKKEVKPSPLIEKNPPPLISGKD